MMERRKDKGEVVRSWGGGFKARGTRHSLTRDWFTEDRASKGEGLQETGSTKGRVGRGEG